MAETVNTYEEPTPESQEHVDAMVGKSGSYSTRP